MNQALAITHPVLGIRLWQTLTIENIPRYAPMCDRWTWAQYKPDRLYGLLLSIPSIREWKQGVNTASCGAYTGHRAPQHKCTCGLYAYHDLEGLMEGQAMADGQIVFQEPYICGLVRGWGQVYAHPNGWRSEKAEILALFGDWGKTKRIPSIAEYYQVPILTKRSLPAIMEEFGTPVPMDMRP